MNNKVRLYTEESTDYKIIINIYLKINFLRAVPVLLRFSVAGRPMCEWDCNWPRDCEGRMPLLLFENALKDA